MPWLRWLLVGILAVEAVAHVILYTAMSRIPTYMSVLNNAKLQDCVFLASPVPPANALVKAAGYTRCGRTHFCPPRSQCVPPDGTRGAIYSSKLSEVPLHMCFSTSPSCVNDGKTSFLRCSEALQRAVPLTTAQLSRKSKTAVSRTANTRSTASSSSSSSSTRLLGYGTPFTGNPPDLEPDVVAPPHSFASRGIADRRDSKSPSLRSLLRTAAGSRPLRGTAAGTTNTAGVHPLASSGSEVKHFVPLSIHFLTSMRAVAAAYKESMVGPLQVIAVLMCSSCAARVATGWFDGRGPEATGAFNRILLFLVASAFITMGSVLDTPLPGFSMKDHCVMSDDKGIQKAFEGTMSSLDTIVGSVIWTVNFPAVAYLLGQALAESRSRALLGAVGLLFGFIFAVELQDAIIGQMSEWLLVVMSQSHPKSFHFLGR